MRNVYVFCEDACHEDFIGTLIARLSELIGVEVIVSVLSARGGRGTVLNELGEFIEDVSRGKGALPDLIVVAVDSNCKKYAEYRKELEKRTSRFSNIVIYAIPYPHIERWLLLDSAAFKTVLGKGCAAPDKKCERDRYKKLLKQSVEETGRMSYLGGIEFTKDIVAAMDVDRMGQTEETLGIFINDLLRKFREWRQ